MKIGIGKGAKSLWMTVNEEAGDVIYIAAPNRAMAYLRAGEMLGGEESPLSTEEVKKAGYKAVRVTELVF